jgi:transposase
MEGIKIEEVAFRVGVSTQTLNRWYKFKKEHPKDKISKLIPAYKKVKSKTAMGYVRLWQMEDVQKLIDFKSNVVSGRCGLMGNYKGEGTANGKSKNRKNTDT